jgi:hypothetical protein
MSYAWGPRYIVPSEVLKKYSGIVQFREDFDEELLNREMEALSLSGSITRVTNPWYYRKKGTNTWVKVGESANRSDNFAVTWDTRPLENGQYEILGLMHVFIKQGDKEKVIAGHNIVEVTVEN